MVSCLTNQIRFQNIIAELSDLNFSLACCKIILGVFYGASCLVSHLLENLFTFAAWQEAAPSFNPLRTLFWEEWSKPAQPTAAVGDSLSLRLKIDFWRKISHPTINAMQCNAWGNCFKPWIHSRRFFSTTWCDTNMFSPFFTFGATFGNIWKISIIKDNISWHYPDQAWCSTVWSSITCNTLFINIVQMHLQTMCRHTIPSEDKDQ